MITLKLLKTHIVNISPPLFSLLKDHKSSRHMEMIEVHINVKKELC